MFPVSAVHFLETMKAPPETRGPIFGLMVQISRGWCLSNPISVMHLEFDRYRNGHGVRWIQSSLLTRNPLRMMGPLNSAAGNLIGEFVDLGLLLKSATEFSGSKAATSQLNAVLERAARGVNSLQGRVQVESTGVAHMLGVSRDELPSNEGDLLQAFPSLMVRSSITRAIVDARPSGFERNDIADLGFLSVTLPYFDLVTTDRAMGARIREASRTWTFPSRVVSDIDRLADTLTMIGAS